MSKSFKSKKTGVIIVSDGDTTSGWYKFWVFCIAIFCIIGFFWSVVFVYSGVTYAIGWKNTVDFSLRGLQFEIDLINNSAHLRIEPVITK